MEPLTPEQIRASFVNCTKGESKRLPLPRSADAIAWAELDFLGWSDPGAPGAAYLVAPADAIHPDLANSGADGPDGSGGQGELRGPVGVVLRLATGRRTGGRANMCSLCATFHSTSDVALMVAPRAGAAGRGGNSVGTYICTDLACSAYVRARKRPARVQPAETLSVEEKVVRLRENLDAFLRRVLS